MSLSEDLTAILDHEASLPYFSAADLALEAGGGEGKDCLRKDRARKLLVITILE